MARTRGVESLHAYGEGTHVVTNCAKLNIVLTLERDCYVRNYNVANAPIAVVNTRRVMIIEFDELHRRLWQTKKEFLIKNKLHIYLASFKNSELVSTENSS